MNCRRRGKPSTGSKQVHKDESREGNGVAKKGDTHGMEYKPVKKDPEWDGKATTAEWK
jgi:hypothetical protein